VSVSVVPLAYVNSGRETLFSLSGVGALFVAMIIGTVVILARNDVPKYSRLRRWAWRFGALTTTVLVLGGGTMIGLWVAGSDLFQADAPGSSSSSEADFCSTHDCIPNFLNGRGSIVQCADGTWSHSGGIPGACSDHGGEQ
jgi:hypothetical protein